MLAIGTVLILRRSGNICFRLSSTLAHLKYKTDLPLQSKTVGQLLDECAEKYSDRPAIIAREQQKQLSFRELLDDADRFAAGLKSIGLSYGDKVGIWAPNLIEWLIASIACARAGLPVVALNPALQSRELEYCINKIDVKCIICPEESKNYKFRSILNELVPELENIDRSNFSCRSLPSLKNVIFISEGNTRGAFSYNDIMNIPDSQSVKSIKEDQKKIDVHSIMNIQFTSGTTGFPKAIPRTHFQVVNNTYFVGQRLQLDQKHHTFCWQVPNFHGYGLIVGTAGWHNGSTILYPSIHYSPKKSLDAIKEARCTYLLGTPTMYVDLIKEQSLRNENISPDFALTGGAVASPQLIKDMQSVLRVKTVHVLYGLTESLAAFCSLPGEDTSKVYTTIGHIVPHTEAKVVDNNRNTVKFGVPGELCLKGVAILDGYLGDDKKTAETFDEEGWFYTGDQFIMYEDGYGNIVGRIKDMIIRGGENIYPKEIENFLQTHPNILEVHVVGVPHKRLGEEVWACIATKNGEPISLEEVKQFCDKKLAYFKIPAAVRILKDFPKTTSGKIQKYKLVEQIVHEHNNNNHLPLGPKH